MNTCPIKGFKKCTEIKMYEEILADYIPLSSFEFKVYCKFRV